MFFRVTLPCFGKTQKNNVGPVIFDGDISITQETGGNRFVLRESLAMGTAKSCGNSGSNYSSNLKQKC